MSRKKQKKHEEEAGEAWLLPYSDLMTLLLAVFIVLFAASQIDVEKAKAMSEEFGESMMTEGYNLSKASMQQQEGNVKTVSEADEMKELKEELDDKLERENLSASVTTSIDKRGLVISLNNAIFFDPGSAEIKKEHEKTLLEISEMLTVMDNFIRVEGHTDNVPMSSNLYPSNWDLSAARASNVVRLFYNNTNASPERLIAVGYGEYRPIADNSTEEGRAKNRRIDIILLSDKYDDLEQINLNTKK